jgi:hypothetical protein
MSANASTFFGEVVVGRFSEPELAFLGQVEQLLRGALAGRVPFNVAMTNLLQDLKAIRKSNWDVTAVAGPNTFSAVRTATLPESTPPRSMPSAEQRELLEDFSGLIEFAVRNGISILSLMASLAHDLVELSTYGWDLNAAKADCFRPKATGWARLNREPIADIDETVE